MDNVVASEKNVSTPTTANLERKSSSKLMNMDKLQIRSPEEIERAILNTKALLAASDTHAEEVLSPHEVHWQSFYSTPERILSIQSATQFEPPASEMSLQLHLAEAKYYEKLDLEQFPLESKSKCWIKMVRDGLGNWISCPVLVAKGIRSGPVVGITSSIHGNELNGVSTIHNLFAELDVTKLIGTVVAVPCVNIPGYLRHTRYFSDGQDLNTIMPGRRNGNCGQVYAYNFMEKIVKQFGSLIDLHTASFGRVNSLYVRADLKNEAVKAMAELQQPQIILWNAGGDSTLRAAAMQRGIPAITVEIGNPQLFQNRLSTWSYIGIMKILKHLKMINFDEDHININSSQPNNTVVCNRSYWMYTNSGGVLKVFPRVNSLVRKGDLIAVIRNIFGEITKEYYCPEDGIVIGKSTNPVAQDGDRILHLGIVYVPDAQLPATTPATTPATAPAPATAPTTPAV